MNYSWYDNLGWRISLCFGGEISQDFATMLPWCTTRGFAPQLSSTYCRLRHQVGHANLSQVPGPEVGDQVDSNLSLQPDSPALRRGEGGAGRRARLSHEGLLDVSPQRGGPSLRVAHSDRSRGKPLPEREKYGTSSTDYARPRSGISEKPRTAVESSKMRVWIDATRSADECRVFGMTLLERLLRALIAAGANASEIRVDLAEGSGLRHSLPAELEQQLPLRWEFSNGGYSERLQSALHERAREGLLVLAADTIVDTRLLVHLLGGKGNRVFSDPDAADKGGEPGAVMYVDAPFNGALPEVDDLCAAARWALDSGEAVALREEDFDSHIVSLRRDLAPYAIRLPERPELPAVEHYLFWSNYKGSTDFMTRYVYPPMVWLLVRPLARWRVHPHWVTAVNIIATVLSIPFFAAGSWVLGFAFAYLMSVLDSVDGKLARLTFTSSNLGNYLDHGLDVIHPPFWYLAWGWALGAGDPMSLPFRASIWMFGLYVADRICAPIFKRRTGRSIHGYTALDERMRTYISRRNVNLPIFMVAVLADWLSPGLRAAEYTFYALIAWQAVCLVFHVERVIHCWNAGPPPKSA
jgi:phosphatidylglycerophosphate synthase